ncbi:MAG: zf-HC2 domain-containing protein [Gemmatimonadales bacterium]|jgi:mycothiol system anti-sigma-R factor
MSGFIRGLVEKLMPQPGGIDCESVMAQLYEYLDEELDDPGTVEKIRVHLEKCRRCYPRYNFEKAFLRFVSDRGHTSAPPGLRRKIFQNLLEEESGH